MALSGAMAHTRCMLRLTFCDANTIDHYFCDVLFLLPLLHKYLLQWAGSFLHCRHQYNCVQYYHLCLLWSHFLQHLSHQLHGGQVQSLKHLQFPHDCCFSVLWIRGIYVSISNHLLLGAWVREVTLLSFTPMWLLWWTPYSTTLEIKMWKQLWEKR